jgi:alkylhydroperoxidase/carboxymuconolactone decarboxylase family protein YurZ
MRRLALNDESAIESALHVSIVDALEGLDAKTGALVRLAGLIALQSCDSSLEWGVSTAVAAGATDEEIVAVVAVVAPIVGSSRTSCCSAAIASALGHSLDLPE